MKSVEKNCLMYAKQTNKFEKVFEVSKACEKNFSIDYCTSTIFLPIYPIRIILTITSRSENSQKCQQ